MHKLTNLKRLQGKNPVCKSAVLRTELLYIFLKSAVSFERVVIKASAKRNIRFAQQLVCGAMTVVAIGALVGTAIVEIDSIAGVFSGSALGLVD